MVLIGMAIIAIHLLDEGRFSSMTEIAAAEGIDLGQASKMSRLAQLAPDLIEAIALGRREVDVSAGRTKKNPNRIRVGISQIGGGGGN